MWRNIRQDPGRHQDGQAAASADQHRFGRRLHAASAAAAPGIGFAIPSFTVSDIANQLIKYGHVINSHRAYLGIELAGELHNGAVVASVRPVTQLPAPESPRGTRSVLATVKR